jgi:hypothetical protein
MRENMMPLSASRLLWGAAAALAFLLAQTQAQARPSRQADPGELSLTKFWKIPIHSFDRVKFGGSIEETNDTYPYAMPNTDIRSTNRLDFRFDMDARVDDHVELYGELKVRTELPQSPIETRVVPREAWLNVALDRWNVRAGYQIFTWGAANLYNPTDTLNPYDYTDIFDWDKEGIPALAVTYSTPKITIEGIWMPIPDESELPAPDSRFVEPFTSEIDNPLFPVFGVPPANYDVTVNYLDPKVSLRNSQFGARVLATVGRFDLGLSYYNGFEHVPHTEILAGIPDPVTKVIPVTANFVFLRRHVIGFDVAAGYEGLNLNMESALVIPYSTAHDVGTASKMSFTYAVGGDYTFFDLFGKNDFTIIMEFLQQINADKPHRGDFSNLIKQDLLNRLEYRFSQYLRARVTTIVDVSDGSYYVQPEVTWEPVDDLELTLGGNILDGPDDTFAGVFDKQDRVYAKVKYHF